MFLYLIFIYFCFCSAHLKTKNALDVVIFLIKCIVFLFTIYFNYFFVATTNNKVNKYDGGGGDDDNNKDGVIILSLILFCFALCVCVCLSWVHSTHTFGDLMTDEPLIVWVLPHSKIHALVLTIIAFLHPPLFSHKRFFFKT